MHAIHHTKKYSNHNYGFLFSFWDKLFGTILLKKYKNETFGIDSYTDTYNPFWIQVEGVVRFYKEKVLNK